MYMSVEWSVQHSLCPFYNVINLVRTFLWRIYNFLLLRNHTVLSLLKCYKPCQNFLIKKLLFLLLKNTAVLIFKYFVQKIIKELRLAACISMLKSALNAKETLFNICFLLSVIQVQSYFLLHSPQIKLIGSACIWWYSLFITLYFLWPVLIQFKCF